MLCAISADLFGRVAVFLSKLRLVIIGCSGTNKNGVVCFKTKFLPLCVLTHDVLSLEPNVKTAVATAD